MPSPSEYRSTHARFGSQDELELDGRVAGDRAACGPELAVHRSGIRAHGVAPRVDQIAGGVVQQSDTAPAMSDATEQGPGHGHGVDVQPHVRRSHENRCSGADRLRGRPVERPFG